MPPPSRFGDRLGGSGTVIDQVASDATLGDVCRLWCDRWPGEMPEWVEELAGDCEDAWEAEE